MANAEAPGERAAQAGPGNNVIVARNMQRWQADELRQELSRQKLVQREVVVDSAAEPATQPTGPMLQQVATATPQPRINAPQIDGRPSAAATTAPTAAQPEKAMPPVAEAPADAPDNRAATMPAREERYVAKSTAARRPAAGPTTVPSALPAPVERVGGRKDEFGRNGDAATHKSDVIGANDLLSIAIAGGDPKDAEKVHVVKVNEAGQVTVPTVGRVDATGRTPAELERTITDALDKSGVPSHVTVLRLSLTTQLAELEAAVKNKKTQEAMAEAAPGLEASPAPAEPEASGVVRGMEQQKLAQQPAGDQAVDMVIVVQDEAPAVPPATQPASQPSPSLDPAP